MKKRILTIIALIALVLIPFKNVYAEEVNNDVVGENETTNDVSRGEASEESSDDEKELNESSDGSNETENEDDVLVAPSLDSENDTNEVEDDEFDNDDADIDFSDEYLISEAEITLTPPFVGETNDMGQYEYGEGEYYWDWSTQTNPPVAEAPEDAPYSVEFTYWIMGWRGEEYDTPFIGTFERDTEYHAEIVLYAQEGYHFSDDVVVTVNGEPIDELIYIDYFYNEEDQIISEISVGKLIKPFEYQIIDGDNQTHIAYKDGDLVVTSNGDASKLVELQVDSNTLDEKNYTIESGSTIATVNREYLDTLDAGSHLLTFVYPDGEVSANFEIVKSNNPQTADIIQVWYMLLIISVMGLGLTVVRLRKNN